METSSLRSFLHTKKFEYSTDEFPFYKILEDLFGCEPENLHLYLGDYSVFNRENDQSTLAHKVFYKNFAEIIKPTYDKFMKNFISGIISDHSFYYQIIPTFRIGLPGNKFVGEYHKDSFYNHKGYELNFNLGICNYLGQPALMTEETPNSKKYIRLECPYGSIFSFDHIDCMHGSDVNNTDKTMVSFDFRLAL